MTSDEQWRTLLPHVMLNAEIRDEIQRISSQPPATMNARYVHNWRVRRIDVLNGELQRRAKKRQQAKELN